ncbi:hypothetical protein H0920_13280 [Acinetobacter sp. C_4_1]|uniref:hypothetical protein n=1 Tax=unclassified Acinetobacter TaxID=196816 RepID=UPI0021B806ED|nr:MULTISPECIES: hypothetical protein [unclassified Acinetobacter]MCT8090479.1 hypothetical protein [Acinetobacter sp. F_3_1]MCT8098884.1 hypothetical protein [Acinetobacter sp. C_3_1]MCT8102048.1 hypothetical protein [Acinetobacter sp. C_4_1]MCT8135852.1 hypothetical protein [Acinetobacter sp. T_3_1]
MKYKTAGHANTASSVSLKHIHYNLMKDLLQNYQQASLNLTRLFIRQAHHDA